MKLYPTPSNAPAQQAAEWMDVLKTAGERERAAFDEWLMESPRHVREFLLMTAIDRALEGIDPQRLHRVEGLLDDASNVVPLTDTHSYATTNAAQAGRNLWRWAAAVALFAIGLAAGGSWWKLAGPGSWQHYATVLGEQRAITLMDGSLVHLNTQTRIAVRFNNRARDIRLLQGEALFSVQRDIAHPFRVHTGHAVIQALGTQFDVYRRPSGTQVMVIEGRVRISTPTAPPIERIAAEGAKISISGALTPQEKVDTARATVWRQRRLVFRQSTLAEVIEEFNRYNRTPQFKLAGESIANRHYSGEFNADDPQSLTTLLSLDERLKVERSGDEILIRAR